MTAAELDLVSYFVGIDAVAIDETLEIDGIREGAVALVGCGIPAPGGTDGSDFGLPFEGYEPS